jgi:hypothetical protein
MKAQTNRKQQLAVLIFGSLLLIVVAMLTGCGPRTGGTGGQGLKGVEGAPAAVPHVFLRPAGLDECPAGGSVVVVDNQTTIVCNGVQGVAGANGTNATPVTVVQFCDAVAAYPSTFPEVGLVIGGKVYAVYSTNGGFLTYLPPGTYSSSAVGSSCNFTINPNGTVTR